jgi:hypothetical protein
LIVTQTEVVLPLSQVVLAFSRPEGMSLLGLVGLTGYLATRSRSRPPTGRPIGRTQYDTARVTAIPLMVVGVISVALWIAHA